MFSINEVIINTPMVEVITFPNLLGCFILAIDVVIVKKINGTITTNHKFMNKSPKGLSIDAFSPINKPIIAPIINDESNVIVCL